ncbi:hypothetical protein [Sphingomonas oryzagri]|uniref:Uncharacterized protein n=1 Tax=Sphingomonas oryzagri TaxID=3042314 RepID=A0ABT6N533_9SPHN|nr:hypothetical protein [Sphingomonas oryzagri]MDH7640216.1 hypothetical protein [Sphingomonas oryzagri]
MLETGLRFTGLGVVTVLLPAMSLWTAYVGLHMPSWLIASLARDRRLAVLPLALVHLALLVALIAVIGAALPASLLRLAMPFMALHVWCEWLRRERRSASPAQIRTASRSPG